MTAARLQADTAQSPAHAAQARARPLRFITCGNVDDGKSTLIGRLLWDTKMVMSDHVAGLYSGGTNDNDGLNLPDFSRLLDGLQAEREQGITIDVAYRYFSTANRSYIVADTPGHEQYTGNMATGASTADLAILLVDARAGLAEQTRRHTMIVSLMGIRQVVLVVNKMDLVGYDRARFDAIAEDFQAFVADLPLDAVTAIPTSAPQGENVTVPASSTMPWYNGPTLLDVLETAEVDSGAHEAGQSAFRLSVQRVSRPDESFRGYQGTVSGGPVAVGDTVSILPQGRSATVTRIVTFDGDRPSALPGDAVTLTLDRNIDIARGDAIVAEAAPPRAVRSLEAKLVVLTAQSLDPAKRYWLKSGSRRQRVRLAPQSVLDLQSLAWSSAETLHQNAIATARLRFEEEAVFDLYADSRATGSFVLIDPDTFNTVAGGMVTGGLESGSGREVLDEASRNAAKDDDASEETVTLSLPLDLARQLMRSDLLADRLDEVEIVGVG